MKRFGIAFIAAYAFMLLWGWLLNGDRNDFVGAIVGAIYKPAAPRTA